MNSKQLGGSQSLARRLKREGIHEIMLNPWGARIYVFKGIKDYYEKFERAFRSKPTLLDDMEDYTAVGGFFGQESDEQGYALNIIVISDEFEGYPEDIVWHEALHCTFVVLFQYGVEFDVDNHEVYNYTQGYIAKEIRQHVYGLSGLDT